MNLRPTHAPPCPSCGRPLPPEARACPYCDEPAPASAAGRICAACTGGAVLLGLCALVLARPTPAALLRLPGNPVTGVLLAVAALLLLAPARWRDIPPPSRRERLLALALKMLHRFGAALATLIVVAALRADPTLPVLLTGLAALLLSAAAAGLISRDARVGFLAGLLIGIV